MPDAEADSTRGSRTGQKWILAALALALAVIGLMVLELPEPARAPAQPSEALQDAPDLIMTGAEIHQYRGTGELRYVLNAQEIKYFNAESLTRLTAPRLLLYGSDQAPWQGQAAFGYLRRATTSSGHEEVVFLRKDVRLEQQTAAGDHLRLTTPSLYLYPEREYAETEQDVIIESRVGRTRGTSLQADLRNGLLRLASRQDSPVHTILLPEQFK